MKVIVSQSELLAAGAGLAVVGLHEEGALPAAVAGLAGAGDAKGAFKKKLLLHAGGGRVLVIGLGKRAEADAERLRVAAALAAKEASRLEASSIAWALPESEDDDAAAEALVTGTILGSYRFDRFKGKGARGDDAPTPGIETLTLLSPESVAAAAETARVYAEAQNRARDLQSTPANFATPSYLASRAEEIAAGHDAVSVDVLGPEQIAAKGMGGLVAVSRGGGEPARLIVLRYSGGGSGPTLGLVGKGVTFDTGGISLKPGAGMHEMKYDMSGAAAVLESVAAIAELGLAVDIVAVVPSTENMPSGTAIKPGDVITQYNGVTVEVNNTDAEGRLILADALAYAVELGAERIVDLATLTGAVVIALGSTYAAVIANDDELAAAVSRAGEESGELTWRLPLHPEFKALMKGTVADLSNLASKRKAGTITAASFLEEFVGETPWAHVDIAGTAWEVGREYTGNDASGFGVRLLVELAREFSAS
ncbi:MAG TPA: leucyl aminopeptidase [Solirubrobacterales bacterium]|jgi:leucyl aminopeptidase|nr:leucyl aminopeptidase [Solirubrobacterales bacterium]